MAFECRGSLLASLQLFEGLHGLSADTSTGLLLYLPGQGRPRTVQVERLHSVRSTWWRNSENVGFVVVVAQQRELEV